MRFISIFLIISLAGCASLMPEGRAPLEAHQETSTGVKCLPVMGTFMSHGNATRDGKTINPYGWPDEPGAYTLLSGCHSPKECQWPAISNRPISFSINASLENGLIAELLDAEDRPLASVKVPPSRLNCTGEGLTVTLHDGMAQDGPGAWTIGYEKLHIVLTKMPNGVLLAKRVQKRFDVFWFGLPVYFEDGFWLVYQPRIIK